MELADLGVGAHRGIGQVGVVDPNGVSLGSQIQAFLVCSRSVAGWGEFGVADPGSFWSAVEA